MNVIQSVSLDVDALLLVTMDVQSLYTCIPYSEGIEAVKQLIMENSNYAGPPVEYTLLLLDLILRKNYFKFERQFYLQRTGTAMGSRVAPAFANTFMYVFELKHIYGHDQFKKYGIFYRRYIDDVFFFWTGTPQQLVVYVKSLNELGTPIKFTLNYSSQQISFFRRAGVQI